MGREGKGREGKGRPFGVNLLRSQMSYRAAQELTSYIASMHCLGSTEGSRLLGCLLLRNEAEQKMHASTMQRYAFSAPKGRTHVGLSVMKHQLNVPDARNSCVCMISCQVDTTSDISPADRKHESQLSTLASTYSSLQACPEIVFVSTACIHCM